MIKKLIKTWPFIIVAVGMGASVGLVLRHTQPWWVTTLAAIMVGFAAYAGLLLMVMGMMRSDRKREQSLVWPADMAPNQPYKLDIDDYDLVQADDAQVLIPKKLHGN